MADFSFLQKGIPWSINAPAIRLGTHDEDLGNNPLRHFYNPATGKGLPGFQNAKERAVDWYNKAVKTYTSGGNTAYYELGHALHLLQDMAAPSHANSYPHSWQSLIAKSGYEWWVTRNWNDKISPFLLYLESKSWLDPIKAGNMAGYMEAMATQTYYGGFPYDRDIVPLVNFCTVGPGDSEPISKFLVPAAIKMGSGLIMTFCEHVDCTRPGRPAPDNSHFQGNPDDNFDVSSRRIELEQLDVTKQGWKDLYSRTGIKKGYSGLFLEKTATEAYATLAATNTEANYIAADQIFQTTLDRNSKEVKHSFEDTYYASADVALLSDAFVENAAELLLKRLMEPIREVTASFTPSALLRNQPVLLIPSGALTGFNDSAMLKSSLDEYVNHGGTLIVLAQKHGYDYASIPTPDGKPITAYGWEEDQNCFADSVTIENWHLMLSGQSHSTPSLNVDGYFTGYPASSTILLSRTANGQPALLMYEHGQGRVIVTSMYSDWAYGHGQASQDEIALIRDLLSWAKKPAILPEMKQGETMSLSVTLTNSTATDASSIKLQIWNPDRTILLSEQTMDLAIPAGESVVTNVNWRAAVTAGLGIYHVDYILLDVQRNIIQPQAETDSGRFVISNPPQSGSVRKDIWLSITSPNQEVFFNEPFIYTFHIFNNSATTRRLTLKSWLPHTNRWHEWQVTAAPNGDNVLNGSDLFIDSRFMFETLRAYLYDENNAEIGSYMLSFKGMFPSISVMTTPGKGTYAKTERVAFSVILKNNRSEATALKVGVTVTDQSNSEVYSTTQTLNLDGNNTITLPFTFSLPTTAQGGIYTVSTEVMDTMNAKIGGDANSFELPLSRIVVTPALPDALTSRDNTFAFNLSNSGKIAVTQGTLAVTLKDPDGQTVAGASQPFTLDPAQAGAQAFTTLIPSLKFGTYTLSYTQIDETQTGRVTTIFLVNSADTTITFDKTSYRVRDTANLAVNLTNTGRFDLDNLSVTVSVPDAGYADTKIMNLRQGQTLLLQYPISLPAAMTAGQHTMTFTLTLPSGASIGKNSVFTVPQSSLALALSQNSYIAGSTISPVIANSGGVDTQAQYRISLYDSKSVIIADQNLTENVPANGTLTINLPAPTGAVDGSYNLVVSYKDLKTGAAAISQTPLTVAGVKALLTVQTNKQSYLSTEKISVTSNLLNSGAPLQSGNLHLQVTSAGGSQLKKTWTTKYDFQMGARSGVDTFETPDAVTLVSYSDDFNDGVLDTDRWTLGPAPNGPLPSELNSSLMLIYPWSPGGWYGVSATTKTPLAGDFDSMVDYNISSPWQPSSDNHPASMLVYVDSWNARIDVWASSPTYGSIDSYGSYTNSGGATLNGKFRIKRVGNTYYMYSWDGSSWVSIMNYAGRPTGPAYLQLLDFGPTGNSNTTFDNFVVSTQSYPSSGTLNLKYDSGRSDNWSKLAYSADTPAGTSLSFRTRTAETEDALTNALWSSNITSSEAPITSPKGRWIEVETTLATSDSVVTPKLYDLSVTQGYDSEDILWQADFPCNLDQGAIADLRDEISARGAAGKYYLREKLTSTTGQTIASSEISFYVDQGNTTVTFNADKKAYKPGETVTVTGEVKNFALLDATGLSLTLKTSDASILASSFYAENFDILAGASHTFTATVVANAEGGITLTGTVTQNDSILAQLTDQYLVTKPLVTAITSIPDVAGNAPFPMTIEIRNEGMVAASVNIQPSFDGQLLSLIIPTGETKLLQFSREVSADTSFTFTFTGDLTQTVAKTVKFGLKGTIAITPHAFYPEGRINVPVGISSAGLLDGQFSVDYRLNQANSLVNRQTVSYYLAQGVNTTILALDLAEGSYQLTASGTLPGLAASAGFKVRKEVKADLVLAVAAQTAVLLPIAVNATNLGYSQINGMIQVSLLDGNGAATWTGVQDALLPFAQIPAAQSFTFTVNLASLRPGTYTIKAELLDAANRQLAMQTSPFALLGPVFELAQLPEYRTVPAGGSTIMTFKVKNKGDQEGKFDLSFKADDLADSTSTQWLKPGEEKEVAFQLVTATDLEEKDYTATFRLKSAGSTIREGIVAYHLAGINLAVTASLDRQAYSVGEAAGLALTIAQQGSGPALDLFARINYNGYEEKRDFTLNGSQALTFTVPLSKITGEKLFYGIYSQSGRSIHLNTIYIRQADAALTVTTDKQVYNPGETITISAAGAATGELTLSGPGDFNSTFAFSGSASRNFELPSSMTAGTYTVAYKLVDSASTAVNGATPFDVKGIQVKVKEALLDKAKYASTDNMNLALTIESNQDLAATVKTWVVDPLSSYTNSGGGEVALTAAAPVIVSQKASLTTTSTGIHKLVYGVYQGDLLLASGAKAFDIGEAVLLGISTDKADYPGTDAPVTARADLYGTAEVGVELFLDRASIRTDAVALAGFTTYTQAIAPENIAPGRHFLKAVLTSGALTSTKETTFTFGNNLPNLTIQVSVDSARGSSLNLTVNISNQGKTASGATTTVLYSGDPAQGATPFATLNVPALEPGATAALPYVWNVLGKSGDYVIYAVIDPTNGVIEYDEANNATHTSGSFPKLALGVSTGGASYQANAEVGIAANYANLCTSLYQDLVLRVELVNPQGVVSVLKETAIASIAPVTEAIEAISWNSAASQAGSYTVKASLLGGGSTLLAGSCVFSIVPIPTPLIVTASVAEGYYKTAQTVTLAANPPQNITILYCLDTTGNGCIAGNVYAAPIQIAAVNNSATITDLVFLAKDAGNNASQPITRRYTIDPVAPTLNVSMLPDGSITNGAVQTITGNVGDNMQMSGVHPLTLNGNEVPLSPDTSGTGFRFSYPYTLHTGTNTVSLVATDMAGNTASDKRAITLDQNGPVISVSAPAASGFTKKSTVDIIGTVDKPVRFVKVTVNGDTPQPAGLEGNAFSISVSLVADSANSIDITAEDLAGSTKTVHRTVTYSTKVPALTVTTPVDALRTSENNIILNGSASGSLDAATVAIAINGTETYAPTVTTDGNFSQRIKIPAEQVDGTPYAITIKATDQAGNQSSLTRHVYYSTPDLNGDGKVDIADVLLALQMANGLTQQPAGYELYRADIAPFVNGQPSPDGIIDVSDAVVLLRKVVGLVTW